MAPTKAANMMIGLRMVAVVLALLFAAALPAHAAGDFAAFVEGLWPDAMRAGVSRATFDRAFDGLEPDLKLPDLAIPGKAKDLKGQSEFTKLAKDYLDVGYLEKLAGRGRELYAEHATALKRIERLTGVPGPIILAIWGRETAFGGVKLPHDAIRVLATHAFIGQRRARFRPELIYALKMLENGIPREKLRSSWAGAVGQTQFMPSDFYTHAADGDGDGVADLVNSIPDALMSAANQLKNNGWVAGQPWGFEVVIPPTATCALEGPPDARPIGAWAKLGFVRVGGRKWKAAHLADEAYLMMPMGAYGPAFLAPQNFRAIRAYNTSDLYALFVGNLADRIAGGGDFVTPWAAVAQPKTRTIEGVQARLKDLGLPFEKIDGKIGSFTRRLIGQYQQSQGLEVDCWPSDALLRHAMETAAN